jgi:hypothetical protein
MGNDCWYYRAQYAGMTKVCMRQSIVECGRIRRFGLCPIPPDILIDRLLDCAGASQSFPFCNTI